MPKLPHPDYPALKHPHFERIDEYQAIWMQHWEEPIQYEDGGQSIKVNKLLAQQSGKVWRLMDYERITGILESSHTNDLGGCLLIGSPGIGKSTYLVYHLVQRLSQGLPTYFYDGLTIYFDATGAYVLHFNSDSDHAPFLKLPPTMFLVDSDNKPVPSRLWQSRVSLFIVLATSPKQSQFKELEKYKMMRRIIPKIPSFEEALHVWGIPFNSSKVPLLKLGWKNYGPDFRLGERVIHLGEGVFIEHEKQIADALAPLSYSQVVTLISNANITDISHKLVHSFSTVVNPTILEHRIHSGLILRMILHASKHKRIEDRESLFDLFTLQPKLAPSLGHLFEIMSIQKLAGNFHGVLKSLQGDPTLDIHFESLPIQLFDNQSATSHTMAHGKFYIPRQKTNKAYDAFRYDGTTGYGFQKTLRDNHELNSEGMLDLCKRMEAAGMLEFLMVIVTPMNINFQLPKKVYHPQTKLQIRYYQVELDLGHRNNWLFETLTDDVDWDSVIIDA
ncbi:hypothetical protein F5890DRAFT_1561574 [Lentinula detonsa]|uniref:Uncharacterized protein n=1 Tax=Lentinula detonsa TaxID=2804962 RepID=A0AA38QAU3_9AGAR|nr:hypothetical protein F5890DRAFT_1561574 [Lentinula detonsa]